MCWFNISRNPLIQYAAYPRNLIYLAVEFPMTQCEFDEEPVVFSSLMSHAVRSIRQRFSRYVNNVSPHCLVHMYLHPLFICRFNARHRLQEAMDKSMSSWHQHQVVFCPGPAAFTMPGMLNSGTKHESARRSSLTRTIIIAHNNVENDNSRTMSMNGTAEDSGPAPRKQSVSDNCV